MRNAVTSVWTCVIAGATIVTPFGPIMPKASQPAGTYRGSLPKIHELDDALALMYFGWRGMTLAADNYLATLGLSRAHHRILYVIARRPGISVGTLIEVIGVSKQAMNKP